MRIVLGIPDGNGTGEEWTTGETPKTHPRIVGNTGKKVNRKLSMDAEEYFEKLKKPLVKRLKNVVKGMTRLRHRAFHAARISRRISSASHLPL